MIGVLMMDGFSRRQAELALEEVRWSSAKEALESWLYYYRGFGCFFFFLNYLMWFLGVFFFFNYFFFIFHLIYFILFYRWFIFWALRKGLLGLILSFSYGESKDILLDVKLQLSSNGKPLEKISPLKVVEEGTEETAWLLQKDWRFSREESVEDHGAQGKDIMKSCWKGYQRLSKGPQVLLGLP